MSNYVAVVMLFVASLAWGQEQLAAEKSVAAERDPTRPLTYSAGGKHAETQGVVLRLSSVLISTQRKLAIINGQTLHEGQTIPGANGARLISINQQGVVVQQDGQTRELRIAPHVIKKN